MLHLLLRFRISSLFLCLLFCTTVAAHAEMEITAVDGRTLNGKIDSRTDDELLWVRHEEQGLILSTSIEWTQIQSASLNGEEISIQHLAEQASAHASESPAGFLTEYEVLKSTDVAIHGVSEEPAALRRIVRVEVDATIANFNRNVEQDGIVLFLSAIDAAGRGVPVRGSIYVRLVGMRTDAHTGRVRFEEIQRWSKPLDFRHFEDGVAEFGLSFRSFRPEFDLEVCGEALVHVRVGAYGQGNFEASVPILLHQFSPIRDHLERLDGSRYFRNELTTNTRQSRPATFSRGLSPRPR